MTLCQQRFIFNDQNVIFDDKNVIEDSVSYRFNVADLSGLLSIMLRWAAGQANIKYLISMAIMKILGPRLVSCITE